MKKALSSYFYDSDSGRRRNRIADVPALIFHDLFISMCPLGRIRGHLHGPLSQTWHQLLRNARVQISPACHLPLHFPKLHLPKRHTLRRPPDVSGCLSAGRERHHAEVVALHEGYLQKYNEIMSAAAVHA
ncbi:Uncharacterized protein DAT39_015154 [Clarias magur]|uniref:Uncharacterized protein n=1 Tax=Clarias magur TaxID=1594786 RepID=A0A8J4TVJ9_CLAMG|nr:Uncharacterized protein DAT39_015154 [Clarias magur]